MINQSSEDAEDVDSQTVSLVDFAQVHTTPLVSPSISTVENFDTIQNKYESLGTVLVEKNDEEKVNIICRWVSEDGIECGKNFSSAEALAHHIDIGHDLQRQVCMWSGCLRNHKQFDARYKLVIHLRCHTGEKPYSCSFPSCTRTFSRQENLKLHSRTHTGEKPYPCLHNGCDKRFNNTSDRAKHMKTHIERKPYPCKYPGCSKRYTDPSSMRKHFRFSHQAERLIVKKTESNTHNQNSDNILPVSRQPLAKSSPPVVRLSYPSSHAVMSSCNSVVNITRDDHQTTSSDKILQPRISCSNVSSGNLIASAFPIFIPVLTPVPVPVYASKSCLLSPRTDKW